MGANPLQGQLEVVALKFETFLGPENSTSKTLGHKITNVPVFI
jgi:hypothetical protein